MTRALLELSNVAAFLKYWPDDADELTDVEKVRLRILADEALAICHNATERLKK